MSDQIGGIAILDRRNPARQWLSCFGFRDNKPPTYIHIPIRPKGTPKTEREEWEYDVAGDQLNCFPSVRETAGNNGPEMFHNGYNWTVKFKDAVSDPYEELKAANPGCRQFE